MKMKRMIALLCALMLLTGCAGGVASIQPQASPQASQNSEPGAVKTGLAVIASTAASRDADSTRDGLMQADMTLVALTIDDAGVIDRCVIDGLQAGVGFDTSGRLTTDPGAQFPTKNELGAQYGLHAASPIGREWNEQAAAFAAYVCGKTADEVAAMPLNDGGRPAGAELVASVTISVNDFIRGVQLAAQNARPLGAQKGDSLHIACLADASASKDGMAQLDTAIAAVSLSGGRITGCAIEGVRALLAFDDGGNITSDPAAGVTLASSDAAWVQQADAFCAGLRGSTPDAAGDGSDDFEQFRRAISRLGAAGTQVSL